MGDCQRCGKCCLEIPCMLAQILHNIDENNWTRCPELVQEADARYKCLLIERDEGARSLMIDGECDGYGLKVGGWIKP